MTAGHADPQTLEIPRPPNNATSDSGAAGSRGSEGQHEPRSWSSSECEASLTTTRGTPKYPRRSDGEAERRLPCCRRPRSGCTERRPGRRSWPGARLPRARGASAGPRLARAGSETDADQPVQPRADPGTVAPAPDRDDPG